VKLGIYDCSQGITKILYSHDDLVVRTALSQDIAFIDKLQKENSYAIGFIQKTIWEDYVFGGKRNFVVFICEKNNTMVGYILITPGKKVGSKVKIQQIAVQEDARRLDYGTALIKVVKDFCTHIHRKGATLRCRTDLESNAFWERLGFRKYGTWEKGKINHVGFKASNDINLWTIDLNDTMPTFFDLYPTIDELDSHLVRKM
jgi:predicted GNAT family N-acyltransferase